MKFAFGWVHEYWGGWSLFFIFDEDCVVSFHFDSKTSACQQSSASIISGVLGAAGTHKLLSVWALYIYVCLLYMCQRSGSCWFITSRGTFCFLSLGISIIYMAPLWTIHSSSSFWHILLENYTHSWSTALQFWVHMHPFCWLPDTYARYQCHAEKLPVVMVHKSQDFETRILFFIFFMLVLNKKLKFYLCPFHEGI
jgi:hypothetical protein